jgi:hypothetical protein
MRRIYRYYLKEKENISYKTLIFWNLPGIVVPVPTDLLQTVQALPIEKVYYKIPVPIMLNSKIKRSMIRIRIKKARSTTRFQIRIRNRCCGSRFISTEGFESVIPGHISVMKFITSTTCQHKLFRKRIRSATTNYLKKNFLL